MKRALELCWLILLLVGCSRGEKTKSFVRWKDVGDPAFELIEAARDRVIGVARKEGFLFLVGVEYSFAGGSGGILEGSWGYWKRNFGPSYPLVSGRFFEIDGSAIASLYYYRDRVEKMENPFESKSLDTAVLLFMFRPLGATWDSPPAEGDQYVEIYLNRSSPVEDEFWEPSLFGAERP